MIDMSKYAVTAKLKNGKQVLLEQPDYHQMKISFRYLRDDEIKDNHLALEGNYIFLEAPIYRTVEDGQTILFAEIEATPIVLHRFG